MIRKFQAMKGRKGFTLVELIVVIAIIGVLAAILVPTMLGIVTRARVQSANSTAAGIQKLINVFMTEHDGNGDRMASEPTVLKITVKSGGGSPAVWTSTAAAANSFHDWKGGAVTWGAGGSYTEGTDISAITSGEALICATIHEQYSQVRSASIVVVLKKGRCTFAAFTTDISDELPDTEFPAITAGDPANTFGWSQEQGVSPNGLIIGTAPQIPIGDGT